MSAYFFLLIILTGILTSLTDLAHKKIKNSHLLIMACAGALGHIAVFSQQHSFPAEQLESLLIAILIATIFFYQNLWRGGDAKLFILYTFLMPPTAYHILIPFACIVLFAIAFLLGLLSLAPEMIINTFHNRGSFLKGITSFESCSMITSSLLCTFCFSWIIFPVFKLLGTTHNKIIFEIICLIFMPVAKQTITYVNRHFLIYPIIFLTGLILRMVFPAIFFHWKDFFVNMGIVLAYAFANLWLYNLATQISQAKERVPFAPFLFAGCLLSYSPLVKNLIFFMLSHK